MRRLPHRYPMLLVDRVLECVMRASSIRAIKNVTANEPFFAGHFPGRPVMPGVMILEALAQAAGILCFVTADIYPDESVKFYFVGHRQGALSHARCEPGDQLMLKATLERSASARSGSSRPSAEVDGEEVLPRK